MQGLRGLGKPSRPNKPALLVIDMQGYFCQPNAPAFEPQFEAVIHPVQELIDAFHGLRYPVFATRYYSPACGSPVTGWWDAGLPRDGQWFDIDDRLRLGNAILLDKELYGTFSSTDIGERLMELGCDAVAICGVMTDLCCETTAREAFQAGYDVLFAADGTATSSDLLHLGALGTLAHGFAYIMDVQEIITLLGDNDG